MEEQTRAVTTVPSERLSGQLEGEQCILAALYSQSVQALGGGYCVATRCG